MPCRRFAVWQNKWRPIDDLSVSGLNATFGCHEKILLRALDEVVWVCTCIMQAAASRGDVTLPLSSGHTLRGKLHYFWNDKEKIRPVTTNFDLKSAYKQLPLSPDGAVQSHSDTKAPRSVRAHRLCVQYSSVRSLRLCSAFQQGFCLVWVRYA